MVSFLLCPEAQETRERRPSVRHQWMVSMCRFLSEEGRGGVWQAEPVVGLTHLNPVSLSLSLTLSLSSLHFASLFRSLFPLCCFRWVASVHPLGTGRGAVAALLAHLPGVLLDGARDAVQRVEDVHAQRARDVVLGPQVGPRHHLQDAGAAREVGYRPEDDAPHDPVCVGSGRNDGLGSAVRDARRAPCEKALRDILQARAQAVLPDPWRPGRPGARRVPVVDRCRCACRCRVRVVGLVCHLGWVVGFVVL